MEKPPLISRSFLNNRFPKKYFPAFILSCRVHKHNCLHNGLLHTPAAVQNLLKNWWNFANSFPYCNSALFCNFLNLFWAAGRRKLIYISLEHYVWWCKLYRLFVLLLLFLCCLFSDCSFVFSDCFFVLLFFSRCIFFLSLCIVFDDVSGRDLA